MEKKNISVTKIAGMWYNIFFPGDNKSGIMSPGSDAGGAVFSSSWDDSNIASHMEKVGSHFI